jgi:hypothetical protein
MTVLGAGEVCCIRADLPDKKSIAETRKLLSEYWFWTKNPDILTQERAIECVPFFDTDVGDTIIFHPQDPNRWYILVYESDTVSVVSCLRELLEFYAGFEDEYPYKFICWDGAVSMGIWGYQSFENYQANHLLELIIASPENLSDDVKLHMNSKSGIDIIDSVLNSRKDVTNILEDVEFCCMTIAVAEIVAGLNGNPSPHLPESLKKWLQGKPKPSVLTIESAKNSISSILSKSKLKQLWQKQEEDYPKWLAVLEDLRHRLG